MADVSAYIGPVAGRTEQASNDRSSGSLSVRASDRQDAAGTHGEKRFHFRCKFRPSGLGTLELRQIRAQPWGAKNHIHAIQMIQIVRTKMARYSICLQFFDQAIETVPIPFITGGDRDPCLAKQVDERPVGYSDAQYRYSFSLQTLQIFIQCGTHNMPPLVQLKGGAFGQEASASPLGLLYPKEIDLTIRETSSKITFASKLDSRVAGAKGPP